MKRIKDFYRYQIYGRLYRFIMRLAHKHGWHYAPPIFPDGDIQLWCQWCGLRETYDGKRYWYNPKTGLIDLRMDVIEMELNDQKVKVKV